MTFNYVYRCSVCDREFDTGRRASNHYQTHKRGGTEAAPAGSAPRSTRSGTSSPPDDGPEGTLSPMELIRGLVGDPPKTTPAQHSLTPRSMDERLSSRKRGQNSASSQHPSTVVRRSSITDAGSDLAASPPETMPRASRGGPHGAWSRAGDPADSMASRSMVEESSCDQECDLASPQTPVSVVRRSSGDTGEGSDHISLPSSWDRGQNSTVSQHSTEECSEGPPGSCDVDEGDFPALQHSVEECSASPREPRNTDVSK